MIRGQAGRPIVPLNLWMDRPQIEATIRALYLLLEGLDQDDDQIDEQIMAQDLIQAFEDIRDRHDQDEEEERERRAAALAAGIPAAGLPGHQEEAPAPAGWSHAEPGPDDLEPIDQERKPYQDTGAP